MSKMGLIHLDTSNTSYGKKKGQNSNWQFDFRPLKVKNRVDFLTCKRRATYYWKILNEGYNFSRDLISIKGRHTKLWARKITRVPTLVISRLPFPLGNPRSKWHLGANIVARHKVYYKGKGGDFPPRLSHGESCKFVFARSSSMHQNAPTTH
jgi:hypothetical protein